MKFWPFDRFSLISSLTPGELETRLSAHIAPPGFWLFKKPAESFYGRADSEKFKIHPVIRHRNSFLPIIVGRFTPRHDGARIDVVQRMHVAVIVFLAFWILGVGTIGSVIMLTPSEDFKGDGSILFMRFLPAFMLAFVWVLTTGGFWWEARRTKDKLMLIFDAVEASET